MTYRIDDIAVPSDDPFQFDQLERQPLVSFLSELVGRLNGPFVMALDSPFGTGKTTLVNMLMEDLKREGHRCTYFNAWKVDYATDPLVALVSSIDHIDPGTEAKNAKYQKHLEKIKNLTTAIAKPILIATGKGLTSGVLDLNEILKVISSGRTTNTDLDIVDEFNPERELLDSFREQLTKAVKLLATANEKTNLVFFIDELDRCRPTFAIHLLERIKHLFDIPDIVFILSIDKKQIEASIKAVYGAEINATEYLRRFFNLEYGIPTADTQLYTNSLITRFGLDPIFEERNHSALRYDRKHFVEFFNLLATAIGLSLRAIERCITRLRIVMDQTPSDRYLNPVLVALLIILRSNQPDFYGRIISGAASPDEVIEYLTSLPGGKIQLSDNNTIILHAYLLTADPDKERAQSRHEKLELDAASGIDENASSILGMKHAVGKYIPRYMSLADIAKKIDLVSWVRE